MKIPGQKFSARVSWFAAATLAALLSAGVLYSATRNHRAITSVDAQEKESGRAGAGDQSTSLNDQTELNVTVYIPTSPWCAMFASSCFPTARFA